MVLKLLVFMVALAVLEGIAGLQEEQFANETQIEANPDHKKRGRRLDKLPCITEQGTCQKIDDPCDGIRKQGAEWCLHHRHFECCHPKGCYLDNAVYSHGSRAVQSCAILYCDNGIWLHFKEWDLPNCCSCAAYDKTTIKPYETPNYSMTGHTGVYPFSWYTGDTISPDFGIDIVLGSNGTCITDASYKENGVKVNIWFNPFNPGSPEVYVDDISIGTTFSNVDSSHLHQLSMFVPPVYISCDDTGIYIIGNYGITLCVQWNEMANPWCASKVYAFADTSVWGNLNGLCGNISNDCNPREKDTPDTNAFINSLQVNPDHKTRGRRPEKLPCIMEQGTCQTKGDPCDGVVREGAEWCLHDRHFECCYPKHCELDGAVYPNGDVAVHSCIELKCKNGFWEFEGLSPLCGICCTSNTTDVGPYVTHDINGLLNPPPISQYSIRGQFGPFSFSQYSSIANPPFGIDITLIDIPGTHGDLEDNNVECMVYFEPGIQVKICCDDEPLVFVSLSSVLPPFQKFKPKPPQTVLPIGPVHIVWFNFGICIIGSQGLSACVYFDPRSDKCPMRVCTCALPTLFTHLYGLCDVWIPIPSDPIPTVWQCPRGATTTDTHKFITSWKLPIGGPFHRKLHDQRRKNPSSDHTGQVTNQTIVERSMSEIEKSCEEMYKRPCTILSSVECEEFKEICVSRISDSQE